MPPIGGSGGRIVLMPTSYADWSNVNVVATVVNTDCGWMGGCTEWDTAAEQAAVVMEDTISCTHLGHVPFLRYNNASFTLDWLNHERADVWVRNGL